MAAVWILSESFFCDVLSEPAHVKRVIISWLLLQLSVLKFVVTLEILEHGLAHFQNQVQIFSNMVR